MFNGLVEEFIIDVYISLRFSVRGVLINRDILNKLKTHLTGELLYIGILPDTLNKLIHIFGILLFSFELLCQLGDFFLHGLQLTLILIKQYTAGGFRDLTEILVLIHRLYQSLQFLNTALIGGQLFTAGCRFFCFALIFDCKKFLPCGFFVINNQLRHHTDIINDQLVNTPLGDIVALARFLAKQSVRCAVIRIVRNGIGCFLDAAPCCTYLHFEATVRTEHQTAKRINIACLSRLAAAD